MVAFLFLWVVAMTDMTAIVLPISAFIIPCFSPSRRRASLSSPFSSSNSRRNSLLSAGKGFGDKPTSPTSTKKPSTPPLSSSTIVSPTLASPSTSNEENSSTNKDSAGSELLRTLRSREAERRDTELRKLRDLRDADALVAQDAGAAVIPEKVAQRMGTRMVPFVGIPLFGSAISFIAFWYLATYKEMEFQPAIVATTSFVFLFIGLLGITYSLLSTSWDEDRVGSGLGVEEFQRNVGSLRDGLSRTRENTLLREKMAGLSEEEIQRAIDGANKREKSTNKKDAWME